MRGGTGTPVPCMMVAQGKFVVTYTRERQPLT